MKNLVEKLKGANYKQLVIDHAEKAGLALVGLLVLMGLVGTEWVPYDKQPEEFISKADQGTNALLASQWPEDKRAELEKPKDVGLLVDELLASVESDRYEFLTPYFFDLYPRKEKIREPEWLAVTDLKIDAHKALLTMSQARYNAPEVDPTQVAANQPKTEEKKPDDEGGLQLRNPGSAQPAATQQQPQVQQQVASTGTDYGLGFRYAAVRGIFPLKEQIDRLDRALHTNSVAKAADFFELMDFELQRQEAVYDPLLAAIDWDDVVWDTVDMAVAKKVLRSVDRFDAEVVDVALTDPVITMPLPGRMVYLWGAHGSHPKIKQLSDEQREVQRLIDEKVMEKLHEQMAAEAKDQPIQKKGFADLLQDSRQARKDVLGGQQGEQLKQKIRQEVEKEMGKNVTANVTLAGGDLLLFRFFDFTVEPGKAYRYRVRLVVRNPNANRRPEELMDAAFMVGETRTTPWSDPSEEKVVENDIHYYVTRVEPARGPLDVNATISVYQWFNEAGTTIKAEFKRLGLGQPIGGETTADVLRPAINQLNRDEAINLSTDAILVDIAEAPELNPALHEDLKIEARKGPDIPANIVAVRRDGSLRMVDTLTSQEQLQKAEEARIREYTEQGGAQIEKQMAAEAGKTALDKALDNRSGGASTKDAKKPGGNPLRKP